MDHTTRLALLFAAAALTSCSFTPGPQRDPVAARLVPRDAAHVLRVRVHVDGAFRRETLDWRRRVDRRVSDASDAMLARFGARLEVTELVEWSHDAPTDDLRAVLAALRAADPSPDVDRVLAFTGALPSYTDSQHQLGLAEIFGQYLVVRGMSERVERAGDADRDGPHAARLRHKEATVLLHELAHTLGGLHEREPGLLMSLTYDPSAREFTPTNERAIARALDLHTDLGDVPHATWRDAAVDAVRAIAEADAGRDRDLRADARDVFIALAPGALTPAEAAALDAARGHLSRDRPADAWATLSDLRLTRPDHPAVTLIACAALERERLAGRPDDPALIPWCERAHAASPGDGYPSSTLAAAYIRAGRPLDALAAADRAEAALTRRPDASATDWFVLAGLFAELGAHSGAERALDPAGMHRDAPALRAAVTARRDYYALTTGLAPDLEVTLWPLIVALEGALQARDAGARDAALSAIQSLGPDLPPALLATCRVDYARRAFKRAVRSCRAATEAAPGSSNAHYNLGIARAARSDMSGAISSLERSIALNPDIESYWGALASILEAAKKRKRLGKLKASYRGHFGAPPGW